jgi:hypothetical protein
VSLCVFRAPLPTEHLGYKRAVLTKLALALTQKQKIAVKSILDTITI